MVEPPTTSGLSDEEKIQRLRNLADVHRGNVEWSASMLEEENSADSRSCANGLRRSEEAFREFALSLLPI